jgi:hypothetical protein
MKFPRPSAFVVPSLEVYCRTVSIWSCKAEETCQNLQLSFFLALLVSFLEGSSPSLLPIAESLS